MTLGVHVKMLLHVFMQFIYDNRKVIYGISVLFYFSF